MKVESTVKRKISDFRFIVEMKTDFIPAIERMIDKEHQHIVMLKESLDRLRKIKWMLPDHNAKQWNYEEMIRKSEDHLSHYKIRLKEYVDFVESEQKLIFPDMFYVKAIYKEKLLNSSEHQIVASNTMKWKDYPTFLFYRTCDYTGEKFSPDDLVFCLFVTNITKSF